jgi:hypothetical protein
MIEWVLIIAMFSPQGEFMSKHAQGPLTKAECERQVQELKNIRGTVGQRFKGLCVTRDHWEGKKQMTGVAYD